MDQQSCDGASQVVLVVKNLPANAGDKRDAGLIPESGRSPGGGHGCRLQYSCLENPKDRGAWRATVHRVARSWTRLKRLSMYARMCLLQPCEFISQRVPTSPWDTRLGSVSPCSTPLNYPQALRDCFLGTKLPIHVCV